MKHRYDRRGLLAIDPKAFFELFVEVPERENAQAGNGKVEIITIEGPLDQHAGGWCDSYEAILERVDAACATSAETILLKVDSQGGLVSGLFEASRALRAKCQTAGKRLVAHIDRQACSAAYALACAADEIVVSETALVGSIGIVDARLDITGANAAMGMRYAFVASGARKIDGNPCAPITDDELAETQNKVDQMAGLFFELVAERRGTTVDAIAGLEARVFYGQKAVDSGLADRVQPYAELLAALAADGEQVMTDKKDEETEASAEQKASDFSDALDSLRKAAEGDGEEAEKARRALKVLEGGAEEEDEGEAAASKEQHDEDDNPRAAASASAPRSSAGVQASTATDLAATVQALSKKLSSVESKLEASERNQLLASRPDLDKSLRAVLRTKPLADVQQIVSAIPKPAAPRTAATATVSATRGEGQGTVQPTSEQSSDLDRRMGLAASSGGMRRERNGAVFNVMSPEQAQKRFAELNGGAK